VVDGATQEVARTCTVAGAGISTWNSDQVEKMRLCPKTAIWPSVAMLATRMTERK